MHKDLEEGSALPGDSSPDRDPEDDLIGQEMLAEQEHMAGCLMQKIRADLYSANAGKLGSLGPPAVVPRSSH